ncbi:MAG: phosphohistidine phosphatase [Lentisphaerae bacterium ADurb.BinA184]|nr:MAG: phosphohistidine phosphatase [Lentisphaerae bacterium ADurb.BinA184]
MAVAKRLLLLRHARAERGGASDRKRPLTPAGRADAVRVARQAREHGWLPDLILCSDSQRTRETAACFAESAECQAAILYDEALYLGSDDAILAAVRGAPEDVGVLMVIGHNPGFASLAQELSDFTVPDEFPAAGLAVFEVTAAAWREVAAETVRLAAFVSPDDLRDGT